MKVTTLNNLSYFLEKMKTIFGSKDLATYHRNVINTYLLNINYDALNGDVSDAILGTGQLGVMILGKDS